MAGRSKAPRWQDADSSTEDEETIYAAQKPPESFDARGSAKRDFAQRWRARIDRHKQSAFQTRKWFDQVAEEDRGQYDSCWFDADRGKPN